MSTHSTPRRKKSKKSLIPSQRNAHRLATLDKSRFLSQEEELVLMSANESQQRLVDNFWGLDKEIYDRDRESQEMRMEDEDSRAAMLKQFMDREVNTLISEHRKVINSKSLSKTTYSAGDMNRNMLSLMSVPSSLRSLLSRDSIQFCGGTVIQNLRRPNIDIKNSTRCAGYVSNINLYDFFNENKPNEEYSGHCIFHWDQLEALKKAFQLLCSNSKIYASDLKELSSGEVFNLLRYTVFSSFVYFKRWDVFSALFVDSPSICLNEWLMAAKQLSIERNIPESLVRSDIEHSQLCSRPNRPFSYTESIFSQSLKAFHRNQIDSLSVGEFVWARHNNGKVWLPAVVQCIHREKNSCCFDLKYILSQKDFEIFKRTDDSYNQYESQAFAGNIMRQRVCSQTEKILSICSESVEAIHNHTEYNQYQNVMTEISHDILLYSMI